MLATGDRPDPVFGRFAVLNSFVCAVTYHEGKLLEAGIARLAAENPALVLMPSQTALPIVPAALEMLKRNDWSSLEGLRLRSEVHYKTSYVPDLFIVDQERHSALIIDVKRSLGSVPEPRLNALPTRMMASALIAGDWLLGARAEKAAAVIGEMEKAAEAEKGRAAKEKAKARPKPPGAEEGEGQIRKGEGPGRGVGGRWRRFVRRGGRGNPGLTRYLLLVTAPASRGGLFCPATPGTKREARRR